MQLLTTGPLDRIGRCPGCGCLFLDTSRNGRRRWCSMSTCGSRTKSARYYATHKPDAAVITRTHGTGVPHVSR
ncbi:MAG: CGNR zinc finger domain-containing protein [Jiangellaceae bacterium]